MNNITIKDIARKSCVSTATVSRVLNNSGYVSSEVKKKVLSVVEELNYRPNAIARSLKMHKTNTIGVIIPDISNPYFMRISKGIEDTIEKSGYILIFVSGDESPEKEEKTLKVLIENRVDAIVLATSNEDTEAIETVQKTGIPIVLVDRKIEKNSNNFNLVIEDNFKGAYQLTKYLIDQGHHRIGVINGLLRVSTGMDRYLGYQQALKEYGLKENPELMFSGNFTLKDGEDAIVHFFKHEEKPTAILSFNNMMTQGAIFQLNKMGLTIPEDIFVASYGETNVSQLFSPPGVVSIKQSPYEMGVKVGEILMDQLLHGKKKPVHEIYEPVLEIESLVKGTLFNDDK